MRTTKKTLTRALLHWGSALALLAIAACEHDESAVRTDAHEHADERAPGPANAQAHEHAHPGEDPHAHETGGAPGRSDGESARADEVTLSAAAIAASGIELATAELGRLRAVVRAPAQIALNREGLAHVGCGVKGRIAEVRARLGASVRAGDVLAVVESVEFADAQSDFLAKASAAAAAAPAIELARSAHERARGLHAASQGIALAEVHKREAELRAAEAALSSAKTAQRAAESRLELLGLDAAARARLAETGAIDARFLVRAPLGWQVVEQEVALGELVGPERDALFVVADTSRLWVLADVPEARLSDVAVGAPARVLIGAEEDHWCDGVVAFVSPALDPRTRTVRARIEALDRHPELRPGVFAQAEIEVPLAADAEERVVVPLDAVRDLEGARVVFVPVAGEDGTFAPRRVTLGASAGGFVELRAGLVVGDRFVAKGAFLLEAELGKSSAVHEH